MEIKKNSILHLPELDVIKTLAIAMMILIHVEEVFFSHVWEDKVFCPSSFVWTYLDGWITVLSPAWFVFSMGATVNFSRRNDPGAMISRGWKLIVAWFLLKAAYAYPLGRLMAEPAELSLGMFALGLVLVSDILFFAGMFLIYFGVLRRLRVPPVAIALLSLALFTAGQFIHYPNEGIVQKSIVGNFVDSEDTTFPFFNWVLHPLLGLCWGWLLHKAADRERVYRIGLAVTSAALLAGVAYLWRQFALTGQLQAFDLDAAYVATPVTLISSFVLFVFCACVFHFVLRALSNDRIESALRFVSVRVTDIYCIQWLVIPWTAVCLPRPAEGSTASAPVVLGWALFVFAVSVALSGFLNRATFARLVSSRKA